MVWESPLSDSRYQKNLKNGEFGKEDPLDFRLERATIAEGQGASENEKAKTNPTQPKTPSSSFFGIAIDESLLSLWKQLSTVKRLEYTSACRRIPPSIEPKKGVGQVKVVRENERVITFFERGNAYGVHTLQQSLFTQVLRFELQPNALILEQMSVGEKGSALRLKLVQVGSHLFKSLEPCRWKEDTYFVSVLFDEHYVHFNWRILAARKHQVIDLVYHY
jgi:hypothetical protein